MLQRLGLARAALAGLVRARAGPGSSRFSLAPKPEEWPTTRSLPVLVVEAEDDRAERALLLAGPPAHDDGVDRADALDLGHADALARAVGRVLALGDHALGVVQPRLGLGRVLRRGREVDRLGDERGEAVAALGLRQLEQHLVVAARAGRRR